MRREDQNRKHYEKLLSGLYTAWPLACQQWLAERIKHPEYVEDIEHKFFSVVDIEAEIIEYLPDTFLSTLEEDSYNQVQISARRFYHDHLVKYTYDVQNKAEEWYRRVWRKKYLNFQDIPPAPQGISIKKYDNWTYQVGPLTVRISGRGRVKFITVSIPMILDITAKPIELADCPKVEQVLPRILPRLKAYARICDWTQITEVSPQVRRAIRHRYNRVHAYFEGDTYRSGLTTFDWYYYKQGKLPPVPQEV